MVLREEFTGRAESAWLSHFRCRKGSASAEKFGGLVFFQGMLLTVLPPKQPFLSHIPIPANILSDMPSKRVY
jgi:hypothetical protein